MPPQKKKPQELKLCPKGHQNSPNALNCWVCGLPLDSPPAPKLEQKTNTTFTTPTTSPPAPSNYKDLNYAEEECSIYVPGRQRCDDKDPSGIYCTFYTMGCSVRNRRFKNSNTHAKTEGP